MAPAKTKVSAAHLRPITPANFDECIGLEVSVAQQDLVAANLYSLAEAGVNPNLTPLGIYDVEHRGHGDPSGALRGFIMYEIENGVGFVLRLMVGQQYQGRGYGRAALLECIRRLRLTSAVELIATSHREQNSRMARLLAGLGFVPWREAWMEGGGPPGEVFVRLPNPEPQH